MYRVEWLQSALDELARLWTQADSSLRQAVSMATHQLDEILKNDPVHEGESRTKGRRITFLSPLAVIFRVEADDRAVTVVDVFLFVKRSR